VYAAQVHLSSGRARSASVPPGAKRTAASTPARATARQVSHRSIGGQSWRRVRDPFPLGGAQRSPPRCAAGPLLPQRDAIGGYRGPRPPRAWSCQRVQARAQSPKPNRGCCRSTEHAPGRALGGGGVKQRPGAFAAFTPSPGTPPKASLNLNADHPAGIGSGSRRVQRDLAGSGTGGADR
jgi:hypothetical protein